MKDRFGREIDYLRISVTDKCNLRCKYCMPEDGVELLNHDEVLSIDEYLEIIDAFREMGLRKVRLTGGEPLVKKGLTDLIRGAKERGVEEVALTTNGTLLNDRAEALKEAGLDRVNISLDTLDKNKYENLTRRGRLEDVLDGIDAAKNAGLTPVKINTVLVKGYNDDEFHDLVEWAGREDLILRFIELMPIGEGIRYKDRKADYRDFLNEDFVKIPAEDPSSPAEYYRYKDDSVVGFINPISCKFCSDCNRLRLDCRGHLLMCLHSADYIDLKEPLRKGENIGPFLRKAVYEKPEAHHLDEGEYNKNRMNTIGG